MSARFTRRTLLGVLAAGHAVARRALVAPPLRYTLALRPARALLGDPIVAVLACAATAPIEAATFDDASLALELRRTQTSDPALAFVNRGGAQRGNVQMRIGFAARQHLGKGERLTREMRVVASNSLPGDPRGDGRTAFVAPILLA